ALDSLGAPTWMMRQDPSRDCSSVTDDQVCGPASESLLFLLSEKTIRFGTKRPALSFLQLFGLLTNSKGFASFVINFITSSRRMSMIGSARSMSIGSLILSPSPN